MIDGRTWLFFAAVSVVGIALVAILVRSYRRARSSVNRDWEQLLSRLVSVDRSLIAEVALDIIDDVGEPRRDERSAVLEPGQIWKLIGGMRGIEIIQGNCKVLIDLASYVQQWYPEAVAVAEQLRLSAREIEWHVDRLKSAQRTGKLESAIPMYAQRAVAVYYLMTRRLLSLYEEGNVAMLRELQRAL